MITVVLSPAWDKVAADRPRLFFPLPVAPKTMEDLIKRMDEECPGLLSRIIGENGKLRDHVHIMVDSTETRDLGKELIGRETIAFATSQTET